MTMFETDIPTEEHSRMLDFYRRRKVLVVGADGFLGVNCLHALQQLNAELTILTRNTSPRAKFYRGRVVKGDLLNTDLVRDLVFGQEIVFNFAGGSSAHESNLHPEINLKTELQANLTLFNACAVTDRSPLLINCSSRLVYGKPRYLPVDELHPVQPQSIYAAHKLTAENYLAVFAATFGLRFINFRLSNPYGPYQSPNYKGYGVINRFLQNAALHRPIVLYGEGLQRRDYILAADAIYIFLLSALTPECNSETFNLGGSQAISMVDAAQLISTVAGGTPIEFVSWPEQTKMIETGDYETDMSKLSRYLPLPEQRSLKEGFEFTVNFYRKQFLTQPL